MNKPKILVRWTAVYETEIEMEPGFTDTTAQDAAVDIRIEVPGSEYQGDTWEVEALSELGSDGEIKRRIV